MRSGILLVFAVLGACGADPKATTSTAGPSPSTKRLCDAACAVRQRCGAADAAQAQCSATCASHPKMQRTELLRPELVEGAAACLDKLACQASGGETVATAKRCIAETLKTLPASPKATSTCERLTELAARCDASAGMSVRSCVDRFKAMGDEFLDHARSCTDEPCREARGCLHDLRDEVTGE